MNEPTYEYRVRFRDEAGQVQEARATGVSVEWPQRYRSVISIERRIVGPWECVAISDLKEVGK